MKLFQILLPSICLFGSCASVRHTPVDANNDKTNDGIRYYNSSPYLLVYSNGKGGLVTQILFIADPTKKMSVKVNSFLSTAQTTMEFDNGVYKSAKNTIDATAFPQAIIKAVQAVGVELLSAANAPSNSSTASLPAPYLYRILINGNKVSFVGGKGNIDISVNIVKEEKGKDEKSTNVIRSTMEQKTAMEENKKVISKETIDNLKKKTNK